MLRSELQIALNDLEVACQEAADGHESAAGTVVDEELAGALRAIAAEHRSSAETLGDRLRDLGDLPSTPDADLETIKDLLSRVKAALSPDERQSLLEDRVAAEARLEQCADLALEQPELSEDTRAVVSAIRDQARAAQTRFCALARIGALSALLLNANSRARNQAVRLISAPVGVPRAGLVAARPRRAGLVVGRAP